MPSWFRESEIRIWRDRGTTCPLHSAAVVHLSWTPKEARVACPVFASMTCVSSPFPVAIANVKCVPRFKTKGTGRSVANLLSRSAFRQVSGTSPTGSKLGRDTTTRAFASQSDEYSGPLDVVALGNMCVDILHPPGPIPDAQSLKTSEFLTTLDESLFARERERWEVGGNCNFLIAAARLGMRVECVGHVGNDAAGTFLKNTLHDEGVPLRRLASRELVDEVREKERKKNGAETGSQMDKTLVCHVLRDGDGGHAFCSRYDLGPWPLLAEVNGVDDHAAKSLGKTRAVFVNGFVFDELKPSAVKSAVAIAKVPAFPDPNPPDCSPILVPEGTITSACLLIHITKD